MVRILPPKPLEFSSEGPQGKGGPSGMPMSDVSLPSNDIDAGVIVVGWEGGCQLMPLSLWGANGVFRSSSTSSSCS
jgi:hypothetical protein